MWFLSPELEEGGDRKCRRHVLLTECDEGDGGVLSFASTRQTEARFGAVYLHVDPAQSADRLSDFTSPTYVYPGRLVAASPDAFVRLAGKLVHEMPRLRVTLGRALGLGTGTTLGHGSAAASWRGRVVRLSARGREITGCSFAIILSEGTYSRSRRYQVIVPAEDIRVFQPEHDDMVVTGADWVEKLGPAISTVLIAVTEIQSIYHPVDIAGWTGAVVDEETLAEIEARLRVLFEL